MMRGVLLAVAVIFAVMAVASEAALTQVNVGGIFFLTTAAGGPDSAGVSRQVAFLAALRDINANTRYNTTLVLQATYYDTQRVAAKAATFATQAIAAGNVALAAVLTTPETIAVVNVSGTVPVVSSAANAPLLSNSTAYPYFLRNIPSGADQTGCLSAVITAKIGTLGAASVYTSDDASTSAIAAALFSKLTTLTPPLTTYPVLTGVPDTAGPANFLKASGAHVFPLISQANDVSTVAGAINASGLAAGSYIIAGTDSMLTSALFVAPGSSVAAQNAFACTLAPPSSPQYTAFLASYATMREIYTNASAVPESKAPMTYDLAFMFAEAALSVINGGGDITNHAVFTAALRAVNFVGASGQISFNAGSNDIAAIKSYVVQRVVGTAFPQVGTYGLDHTFVQTDPTFIFPGGTTSGSTSNATTTNSGTTGTSTASGTVSGTATSTSSTSTTSSATTVGVQLCILLFVVVVASML